MINCNENFQTYSLNKLKYHFKRSVKHNFIKITEMTVLCDKYHHEVGISKLNDFKNHLISYLKETQSIECFFDDCLYKAGTAATYMSHFLIHHIKGF
jgi:hypothetical protein